MPGQFGHGRRLVGDMDGGDACCCRGCEVARLVVGEDAPLRREPEPVQGELVDPGSGLARPTCSETTRTSKRSQTPTCSYGLNGSRPKLFESRARR